MTRLGIRLNWIGSKGRARTRQRPLMDLAAELPAVVLGNLISIHAGTAAWAIEAGNTRPVYAAELPHHARHTRHER